MSDPALAVVPTVAPAAAAPAPSALKSGFKTTELYLAMFACGALVYFGNDLIGIVHQLALNPSLPPWVAPLLSLAPVIISGLIVKAAAEYGKLRRDLKLGDASAAAVTIAAKAGGAAANADTEELLRKGNE